MTSVDLMGRIPLADHTSIRAGGPARYYCRPADLGALGCAIRWAEERGLPVVALGGGSNVIFHDSGYPGLVLHTTGLRGVAVEREHVTAASGERLSSVAWSACRSGLSGLEWACGIPGTVGGAVVMNAGTREGGIADVLRHVSVLDSRDRKEFTAADLDLGYRTSALLTGRETGIIVEAEFALRSADADACLNRARELLEGRLARLPVGASAGCIFRNPEIGPRAGELLDRAGCKGMRHGDARVSEIHANFIVNDGRNNAADVFGLIERMKAAVRDAYGIELQEEVVVY
ncbi:UDP-N-acetylmuramate dehydrogenase [Candidatus Bipolaricaulota bacterium]|nr:UDP-N-acetylmuramate dehydrogenase [Candidatus Bipolaricaulota bacterium]